MVINHLQVLGWSSKWWCTINSMCSLLILLKIIGSASPFYLWFSEKWREKSPSTMNFVGPRRPFQCGWLHRCFFCQAKCHSSGFRVYGWWNFHSTLCLADFKSMESLINIENSWIVERSCIYIYIYNKNPQPVWYPILRFHETNPIVIILLNDGPSPQRLGLHHKWFGEAWVAYSSHQFFKECGLIKGKDAFSGDD